MFDDRLRWEFEIRKFSVYYSISKTMEKKGERIIKIKVSAQVLEENEHKNTWTTNGSLRYFLSKC